MQVYNKKILVVDNEIDIRKLLFTRLTLLGYKVFLASNAKETLSIFFKEKPDLIILDIVLPQLDGYSICRKIRENSQVPIIMLSGLAEVSDRIKGFELGADDYLTKPFSPKELETRTRSLLRRADIQFSKLSNEKHINIHIGNLIIDMDDRKVSKNNSILRLTDIEYRLLQLFIDNVGEKLSRTTILNNIWGFTPERHVDSRIVDVHISRLRSKIEEDSDNPDLIITVRGIGYMLQV